MEQFKIFIRTIMQVDFRHLMSLFQKAVIPNTLICNHCRQLFSVITLIYKPDTLSFSLTVFHWSAFYNFSPNVNIVIVTKLKSEELKMNQ